MKTSIKSLLLLLFAFGLTQALATDQSPLKIDVSGQGQPVVLIPGLTCSGDVWKASVEKLSKKYQCHVITLPGFAGRAPIADHEGQYLKKMESLVVEYIAKQGLKNPIIIGHSLGGFIALQIAINQPSLPSKLVIVDSLPFLSAVQMPGATEESAKPFAQNMKSQIVNSGSLPKEQRLAYQKTMLKSLINEDENINIAADWSLESDLETVGQAMYELYTIDIRQQLSDIKVPTLVLGAWVGYKDYGGTRESTLSIFENQYTQLEGVTIDLTDKGKHFIMWDDPEFFHNWLVKFM